MERILKRNFSNELCIFKKRQFGWSNRNKIVKIVSRSFHVKDLEQVMERNIG